jgi:hypothetical protein
MDASADKLSPRLLSIEELIDKFASIAETPVKIGPLTLISQVDLSRGQAVVTAVLASVTIDKQLLSYTDARMQLDVANGQASAKGEIILNLKPSPQFSALVADILAIENKNEFPYKGALASWESEGEPVVGDYVLQLTAELSTLTTVRSAAANIAEFSFLVGALPVASMTATQLAPIQKLPSAVVAGDVRIEAGAQISLTIPTTLEKGFLFLTAEFSSRTTPPTPIGASVANWTLPQQ